MTKFKRYISLIIALILTVNISTAVNADGYMGDDTSALTPDGNISIIDDIQNSDGFSKQFITVTTKSGHYFYIIIDRDDEGNETVHFLNQIDESDLMTIIEDDGIDIKYKICTCSQKCTEGEVDTTCVVCIQDMNKCTVHEPEEQKIASANEEKSSILGMIVILLLAIGTVGVVFYIKNRKQKSGINTENLDDYYFYDEEEEDSYTGTFENYEPKESDFNEE